MHPRPRQNNFLSRSTTREQPSPLLACPRAAMVARLSSPLLELIALVSKPVFIKLCYLKYLIFKFNKELSYNERVYLGHTTVSIMHNLVYITNESEKHWKWKDE